MKQYQYRMKCRSAPNQNWSSWVDCGLQSARIYLKDAKDESNQWTYEVREVIPVTYIEPSIEEKIEYLKAASYDTSIRIEHTAMKMYYNHVCKYPNAPNWDDLLLVEREFWLKRAKG